MRSKFELKFGTTRKEYFVHFRAFILVRVDLRGTEEYGDLPITLPLVTRTPFGFSSASKSALIVIGSDSVV